MLTRFKALIAMIMVMALYPVLAIAQDPAAAEQPNETAVAVMKFLVSLPDPFGTIFLTLLGAISGAAITATVWKEPSKDSKIWYVWRALNIIAFNFGAAKNASKK